jgi:hypothetical protein
VGRKGSPAYIQTPAAPRTLSDPLANSNVCSDYESPLHRLLQPRWHVSFDPAMAPRDAHITDGPASSSPMSSKRKRMCPPFSKV